MKDNPLLAADLLRHYQNHGRKNKIMSVAEKKILPLLEKQPVFNEFIYPPQMFHYKDIEKEIRFILKETYHVPEDYVKMIENLERLFIITESLADYKIAAKAYQSKTEKEAFIERLKGVFNDLYTIRPLFNVLRYENKKKDILALIAKFPKSDCFPQMIICVQDTFPKECLLHYQNMIKELLREPKVKYYPQVAYLLQRMKDIGRSKEFAAFVSWIK